MKKLFLAAIFLFCAIAVSAQVATKEVIKVTTDITGASTCLDGRLYYNGTTGVNWERIGGVCSKITAGGTPGTVTTTGSPASGQVSVFSGATSITGGADLTWTDPQLLVQGLTTTSPGFYSQIIGDTVPRVRIGLNAADVASLGLGSGSGTRDTFLERAGAANFRMGASAIDTAPVAQTISVQNTLAGGTSDVAGANLTVAGSQGKGTGVGGSIIFQTAPAGSTGTVVNALATNLSLASTGAAALNVGRTTTAVPDFTINPTTKASGDLFGAQVNSVNRFSISGAGLGTINAPSAGNIFLFQRNSGNSGIFSDSGSGGVLQLTDSGTVYLQLSGVNSGPMVGLGSAGTIAFRSTTAFSSGATDLVFSRASANVGQIGTTTANALGSLNLTNLTGTGTVKGNTLDATGKQILLNSVLRIDDSATGTATRFTPQGNRIQVFDGANDQTFQVFSSTGGVNVAIVGNDTTSTLSGANLLITPKAYATATNCSDSAGAAACGSAAAGSFVIDAAATSVVVSTTSLTANSQIFVQEDSSLGTRLGITCNTQSVLLLGPPVVTARTAGTSFTVSIVVGPTATPRCLSYHLVN